MAEARPSDLACAEVRDLLSANALGRLAPSRRAQIRQHLCECVTCRSHARLLHRLHVAVACGPEDQPRPADPVPERLLAAHRRRYGIAAAPSAGGRRVRAWLTAGETAVAAVAALLLAFAAPPMAPPPTAPLPLAAAAGSRAAQVDAFAHLAGPSAVVLRLAGPVRATDSLRVLPDLPIPEPADSI